MKNRIAVIVATFFGVGRIKWAPGTMGTLAALPLVFFVSSINPLQKLLVWVLLFFLGTWAAKVYDELKNTSDNSSIVIDEVVGIGTSSFFATELWEFALCFVLFRIFDIGKFFPVNRLDQWSKSQKNWTGGFGVMLDDIGAAVQTGFVFFIVLYLRQWFLL